MTYLLNSYRLFHYLAGRNGDGNVPVSVSNSAENSNHGLFHVGWNDGTEWFVKQPFCPHDLDQFGVANEANVSSRLSKTTSLNFCLPKYIAFDPIHKILITEYCSDYTSLRKQSLIRIDELLLSRNLPEKAAIAMAGCHSQLTVSASFPVDQPAFYFFKPPFLANTAGFLHPLLRNLSSLQIHRNWLSSIIDSPTFREALRDLSQSWRTDTVIHGDPSPDNILIKLEGSSSVQVKLCDWEFAGWGDPEWDCACFFQDLLLSYMDMRVNHAMLLDAGRRFYQAYHNADTIKFPPFDVWFIKVIRLSAVGIIEKMLGKIVKLDDDARTKIKVPLEFLVNSVLINARVLKSF